MRRQMESFTSFITYMFELLQKLIAGSSRTYSAWSVMMSTRCCILFERLNLYTRSLNTMDWSPYRISDCCTCHPKCKRTRVSHRNRWEGGERRTCLWWPSSR
jgi:hypothetical protein